MVHLYTKEYRRSNTDKGSYEQLMLSNKEQAKMRNSLLQFQADQDVVDLAKHIVDQRQKQTDYSTI